MILKAIPRQGGTEEISINIDENASVADLRRFLEVLLVCLILCVETCSP